MTRSRLLRGSTLLLVVVLLLVLSVIGVAAVSAASQERSNASAKGQYDRLVACASAAQAKVWAEMARYGPTYLTKTIPVATLTLPDGSQVTAPGHYGSGGSLPNVTDVVVTLVGQAGQAPTGGAADLTNKTADVTPPGATVYRMVASCKDAQGHEFEVEFALRLAL
jgi:hypothetical protein